MSDPTEALPTADDDAIRDALFALLDRRASGATVCPSEVARALTADDDWRPLMPRIRQVARRLAAQGRLRLTRRGVDVDLNIDAPGGGGPIRLGRPPAARGPAR